MLKISVCEIGHRLVNIAKQCVKTRPVLWVINKILRQAKKLVKYKICSMLVQRVGFRGSWFYHKPAVSSRPTYKFPSNKKSYQYKVIPD